MAAECYSGRLLECFVDGGIGFVRVLGEEGGTVFLLFFRCTDFGTFMFHVYVLGSVYWDLVLLLCKEIIYILKRPSE